MAFFEKRQGDLARLVVRATTTAAPKTSTTEKVTTSKTSTTSAATKVSSTVTTTASTSTQTSSAISTLSTQTSSTTSQTSPASATATAVSGSRGSGLSTGGVVAIIFGFIALILLVALIVVILQKRAAKKRLRGQFPGEKEGFYPLQDPVGPPAATYGWQTPITPGYAGADGQSIHDASSIQNSVGYNSSPMVGPATMVAIPDGLRPGMRSDSQSHDLEIPGFEMRSQTASVAYPELASEHVHELDSTSPVAGTASPLPPGPSAAGTDDSDKIFVSQSNPSEDASQIQEIESAKTRLQERRQRLLELHQVDEEEQRLNQQLAALRVGTPNSFVNDAR